MNHFGGIGIARFFIVDDELLIQQIYRDILEFEGHDVVGQAKNGEECLDMIYNLNLDPDFILMDYRMPIKNGVETTKELMNRKTKAKIIFISADINIKKEALQAGAKEFIRKPFSIDTLRRIIEKLSI